MVASKERSLEDLSILALMSFESDLYRLMDQEGMSRADLAKALRCNRAYISKLLNGEKKNPQIMTLVKLARALHSKVQVRMVRDGSEVLRVMDIETAGKFDDICRSKAGSNVESVGETLSLLGGHRDSGKLLTFRRPVKALAADDEGIQVSG